MYDGLCALELAVESRLAIGLTRHGRREVAGASIVTLAVVAGIFVLAGRYWPWLGVISAVPVALWAWVLWFFRDPDRHIPEEEGLMVSPADGRIADITPIGSDSLLGRDGVQIGIFMNVFDVHVNRAPCDGTVTKIHHKRGVFLDARDPAASERNESATIEITHRHNGADFPVIVRQIAGLVARRIVTDLSEGRQIARGQRIGMIKFGSRLEVLAPAELAAEVRIQVGQKVLAGQTVLMAFETEI